MERAAVELRVGGHTYRVVGSANAAELERLARVVDGKLREVSGSTAFHPQSMLLVAMTLAHELEQERSRGRELEQQCRDAEQRVRDVEQRSRDMLETLVERVDAALDLVDDTPVPPPAAHADT
jgi:cell division protein ZapA